LKIHKILLFFAIFSIIVGGLNAQDDKERVGVQQFVNQNGAFFNFGDKDKVNIEVNVWGYVRYPGKYIVPKGTTLLDLISYSGGFNVDTKITDIRLYRPKNDSISTGKDRIINLNYSDLWETDNESKQKENITLLAGDILIVPGSPKLFFKDNLSIVLSVSSTVISIAILLITILKK
jgi:hypothetical protein